MLLFAVTLMAASLPAAAAPVTTNTSQTKCPRTTSYYAWQRDKPLTPKKLTELPPATGYMAVYRQIGGCEFPMTVVEYRRGGRR